MAHDAAAPVHVQPEGGLVAAHARYAVNRRLAPVFADPAARITGIHVYTFNKLERTERWRRRRLSCHR